MALDAERLAAEVGSLLFTHSSRARFAARLNSALGLLSRKPAFETKTMSNYSFGLSNPYLKIGISLLMVALAVIAFSSFFLPERDLQAVVRNAGGFVLLSGVVIYIIGRFVQARRARAQA